MFLQNFIFYLYLVDILELIYLPINLLFKKIDVAPKMVIHHKRI